MLVILFSLIFNGHAMQMERFNRAGISLPVASGSWQKMQSLPALELKDFDVVYANSQNKSNKRFISTQFGNTSQICQGEYASLTKNGFKVITNSKPGWTCIIQAEKGSDKRFTAVKEVRRKANKHPVLISQALLIEVGAGKYQDFESWIDTVKVLR